MKVIKKSYVNNRRLHAHIMIERDVLAQNRSPFTLRLHESFDDDDHLYFITPFLQGGDLMGLMIRYDIFPTDVARFYLAEILLGLEYLHEKEIAVRDLKLENILIGQSGHLMIADFGLAGTSVIYESSYFTDLIQLNKLKNSRRLSGSLVRSPSRSTRPTLGAHRRSQTMVPRVQKPINKVVTHKRKFDSILGTPETIAYELLKSEGYTASCDIWSLGCILYEMLVGYSPFASDTSAETLRKIEAFDGNVPFPEDVFEKVDHDAIDLITKLICFVPDRLTISEIKAHSFLRGVDWQKIHLLKAPFIPRLNHEHDLKYFPLDELESSSVQLEEEQGMEQLTEDLVFSDFSYINF